MQRLIPAPLRGLLALMAYTLNLILGNLVLLGLFIPYLLLPSKTVRRRLKRIYDRLPALWAIINRAIRHYISGVKLTVTLPEGLSRQQYYLVTANHQSWTDIIILFDIFHQHIPMLKFFMKKQLQWVPFIGQVAQIYGYPLLYRYSKETLKKHPEWKGRDFNATRQACERFRAAPGSLIIFAEGTRFTPQKHQRQQSPWRNLLKPRAGGLALALQHMSPLIQTLLDVTIIYPKNMYSLWQFCCGYSQPIQITVASHSITTDLQGDYENDMTYKLHFQQFLNHLWQQKQQLFDTFYQQDKQ